jgi:hypothetical protein
MNPPVRDLPEKGRLSRPPLYLFPANLEMENYAGCKLRFISPLQDYFSLNWRWYFPGG